MFALSLLGVITGLLAVAGWLALPGFTRMALALIPASSAAICGFCAWFFWNLP